MIHLNCVFDIKKKNNTLCQTKAISVRIHIGNVMLKSVRACHLHVFITYENSYYVSKIPIPAVNELECNIMATLLLRSCYKYNQCFSSCNYVVTGL